MDTKPTSPLKTSPLKTSPLKAGVIGAGVFAGFHANKYAELSDTQLTVVFDPNLAKAQELADKHGAQATDDVAKLFKAVDVVTVASPADTHAEMALAALSAGKLVYVEKPLATTVAEAERIVHFARTLPVACGHQERAVFAAMGLLDVPVAPKRIVACREGAWSGRGADVSVTLDLMVHDLDLVTHLGVGTLQTVSAKAQRQHSEFADHIVADFTFAQTAVALTASRMAEGRKRQMRLEYDTGHVFIDFVARTFENTTPYDLNPNFADQPEAQDPLRTSVAAFVDTVLGRRQRPLVTAAEALEALRLAHMADAKAVMTEPTA